MTQTIKITFGITKDFKNLFYVQVGSDKCFHITEDNAEPTLDYNLVKSFLETTKEGVDYIQNMYKRWYKEFVCKK